MLTEELKEHINGPVSLTFGTCSAQGTPRFGRGCGIYHNEAGTEFTFFYPKIQEQPHRQNLQENPQIALQISDMSNMVTKQYKGTVTEIREATEEENQIAIDSLKRGGSTINFIAGDFNQQGYEKWIVTPALAVTFTIEEIFEQTPGDSAGIKLSV